MWTTNNNQKTDKSKHQRQATLKAELATLKIAIIAVLTARVFTIHMARAVQLVPFISVRILLNKIYKVRLNQLQS